MKFKIKKISKYKNVVTIFDDVKTYFFTFNFASKKDYLNYNELVKMLITNNAEQII